MSQEKQEKRGGQKKKRKVKVETAILMPLFILNPFAPEPPVTARADPRSFYPLWRHQF